MRDITFSPAQTREIWQGEGAYQFLDEAYDRILIYGDRRVFDPITAYGMSDAAAARSSFCGYLAPLPPVRSRETVRRELQANGRQLVVVSVGGGHDGGPLLRAYLEGLRDRSGPPITSYIVTGPLLPESELRELQNLADGVPGIRLVTFDADFAAAVRAADVVVCMGGYNSVAEAVHFGKQPIIVPRLPGPEEQVLRAEGFARLGLATVVDPATLTSASLWAAIDARRSAPPPPSSPPRFDGLNQIACQLSALQIGERSPSRSG
jgi:predicted glycosyltransferase